MAAASSSIAFCLDALCRHCDAPPAPDSASQSHASESAALRVADRRLWLEIVGDVVVSFLFFLLLFFFLLLGLLCFALPLAFPAALLRVFIFRRFANKVAVVDAECRLSARFRQPSRPRGDAELEASEAWR